MSNRQICCILMFLTISNIHPGRTQTTAELLGFDGDDRVLIINADDFGMCHAENAATMDLLLGGNITSATVMVPCPWFNEAAEFCRSNPQADVGIHLTLTSEWKKYKWGSMAPADRVPSLLTHEGYFPEETLYVELWAKPDEVEIELRAQVEKAIQAGIVPTHIDNHMATVYGLYTGHDFFEAIFKISQEYGLPFRLPRQVPDYYAQMLPQKRIDKLRELADSLVSMGFVLPDFLGSVGSGDTREETFSNYRNFLINLKPGVTELYIHAAKESDEIKAITNAWRARDFDYEIFMSAEMKNFIDSLEIHLIGWRKLQRLQIEQLGTYVENFHQTLASDFWIEQNYPNPFNSSTSIEYFLPASKEIALLIFDMSGREVKTVQKGYQLAGWQQTIWNGTDNAGDVVVSGLYFCRFQSGRSSTSIKLSFIK